MAARLYCGQVMPPFLVRSWLLLQIKHRLSETDVRHYSIRNIPHSSRTPDPTSDRKVLTGRECGNEFKIVTPP